MLIRKKNTPLHNQLFHHLFSCSIFLSMFKCNIFRNLLRPMFMNKHDHTVCWLVLYLIYISSFLCAHSMSMRRKGRERIIKKIGGDEDEIDMNMCKI